MRSEYFTPTQMFDKFLTQCRYSRVFKVLKQFNNINKVYDLGCGSGLLVQMLASRGYDAYGIDVKSGDRIIAADLNTPLPLPSESADLMISLANIEHLNEPLLNLQEIYRVLRKGGSLVLTTPSTAAKPVLEFMAFKLKIIDAAEIIDHKRYFSKQMLNDYIQKAGFTQVTVKRFQLGMNLYALAIK
jgi:SAM-dependent methyltransferase